MLWVCRSRPEEHFSSGVKRARPTTPPKKDWDSEEDDVRFDEWQSENYGKYQDEQRGRWARAQYASSEANEQLLRMGKLEWETPDSDDDEELGSTFDTSADSFTESPESAQHYA